jgi:hypothetical protein
MPKLALVWSVLIVFAARSHAQDSAAAATPRATSNSAESAAPIPAAPAAAFPAVPVVPPAPVVDTTWKKELVGSVNASSSYYRDWADGSEDAFAWSAKIAGRLVRDDERWNWTTTGDALFGQVKLGDKGFRKTDDELKAETVLKRKLSRWVDPFVSAGFQTQFAPGWKYPSDTSARVQVSDFLDPLYLSQSAGVGTTPVPWLSTRVGGAVHEARTDVYTNWSDDPKTGSVERWKVEPGVEWVTELKKALERSLLLESKLSVFSNLKGADEIVTVWTAAATWQFSKYVNASASGELHHDIQQSEAWQWKQRLALGLVANFL